jgi:hypothetical protein
MDYGRKLNCLSLDTADYTASRLIPSCFSNFERVGLNIWRRHRLMISVNLIKHSCSLGLQWSSLRYLIWYMNTCCVSHNFSYVGLSHYVYPYICQQPIFKKSTKGVRSSYVFGECNSAAFPRDQGCCRPPATTTSKTRLIILKV